jgi:hypothetical protein
VGKRQQRDGIIGGKRLAQLKSRKVSTRKLVLYFALVCMLILEVFPMTVTAADVYLEWEGEKSTIGGFLTINNFPDEFHVDKTYQVNITITVEHLESAKAVEFGTIKWVVDTFVSSNETEAKEIGYSVIHKNLTNGEKISVASQWSLNENITTKFGTLNAKANLTLRDSANQTIGTQTLNINPHPKITFKSDTILTIQPRTKRIEQGEVVIINGTLNATQGPMISIVSRTYPTGESKTINETITYFEWSKIELIYTNPKGEKINRSTNLDISGVFTDRFKPDMVGMWFVEAKYGGSDYFSSSTSNIGIIYVNYTFPLYFWIGVVVLAIILFVPWFINKFYQGEQKITIEKEKKGLLKSIKDALSNLKKPSEQPNKPSEKKKEQQEE